MNIDPLDPSVTEALRALRVQLDAGLTLTQALPICAEVCTKKNAGGAFQKAAASVAGGADIESVIAQLHTVLSQGERSLLIAGFSAGCHVAILDVVLSQRELWFASRQKIRAGLVYPLFVFIMACLVGPLPALFSSGSVLVYALSAGVPMGCAALLWILGVRLSRARILRTVDMRAKGAPAGPSLLDRFQLASPVLRSVEHSRNISESACLLGELLRAGVLISKALEYAARAASNGVYRLKLYEYSKQTQSGTSLSKCMEGDPMWSVAVSSSVEIGERTGNLDEALLRMGKQAREDYVRAMESWALWFPRLVYGFIGVFVIFHIFMIGSKIIAQYKSLLT